ncbi:MAG: GspH/FimT family pseudopilin [Pseudomonadales bacterium]|nr:GspH/FimT family pseudopilin [Pseudomonadales bacterium]
MRGFTLLELITTLIIATILTIFANNITRDYLPKQRIIAKRNELVGFLQLARAGAIQGKGSLICSQKSQCQGFDGGGLIAFIDANKNKKHDDGEKVLGRLTLSNGTTIFRNGWGKQKFLSYDSMGRLHYQNGHFLICNSGYGTTIILNWRGRVRSGSDPAPNEDC